MASFLSWDPQCYSLEWLRDHNVTEPFESRAPEPLRQKTYVKIFSHVEEEIKTKEDKLTPNIYWLIMHLRKDKINPNFLKMLLLMCRPALWILKKLDHISQVWHLKILLFFSILSWPHFLSVYYYIFCICFYIFKSLSRGRQFFPRQNMTLNILT